jgi:3-oxoacyl-[acyl-carrier-protein] synthase II
MTARRVVVTGLGLLSPLGTSVNHSWRRLIAGESGIVSLLDHPSTTAQRDQFAALPSTVAGIVPDNSWTELLSRDDQRKMGRFAQLAVAASEEALGDAGLNTKELSLEQRERIVSYPGEMAEVGCMLWIWNWEFRGCFQYYTRVFKWGIPG